MSDKYKLDELKVTKLKQIVLEMGLNMKNTKKELIKEISTAFGEYEKYKKDKLDKYEVKERIGNDGIDGKAYIVTLKKEGGREYIQKCFRKNKSSEKIKKEFLFQTKAAEMGVAPRPYEYNTVGKWIIMDKMDYHFVDKIKKDNKISIRNQRRIVEIFNKLDECQVFHNDPNLQNYMVKDGVIYLIDYGFAKEITPKLKKKLGTEYPNSILMLIGLILKLKEIGLDEKSYEYFLKKIPQEEREKYNL